jgi:hypothetical protein
MQSAKSVPALAVVGNKSELMVTRLLVDKQSGLEMVQRKVTDVPGVKPLIVLVGEFGLLIIALPETIVQRPVPTSGVLPARVAVVVPQTI